MNAYEKRKLARQLKEKERTKQRRFVKLLEKQFKEQRNKDALEHEQKLGGKDE